MDQYADCGMVLRSARSPVKATYLRMRIPRKEATCAARSSRGGIHVMRATSSTMKFLTIGSITRGPGNWKKYPLRFKSGYLHVGSVGFFISWLDGKQSDFISEIESPDFSPWGPLGAPGGAREK